MRRRKFIEKVALTTSSLSLLPSINGIARQKKTSFCLDYAPHEGMFFHHGGKDLLDQIDFIYEQGFVSIEDNEMSERPVEMQKKIGEKLEKKGMRMGVFVAHNIPWENATLARGEKQAQEAFLKEIKQSIEIAKRCRARWMTVVPGLKDDKLAMGYQRANIISLLRRACEIIEKENLIMVLEPLNPYINHPGLFLTTSPQAYAICKAVNHPCCKILFDIYHQQVTEGNIIHNITTCWDEIAYFQIGDNPGRNEPTTGELNYKNIFQFIHSKNYKGILGMEHGNSLEGKKGEKKVIQAYRSCDEFICSH